MLGNFLHFEAMFYKFDVYQLSCWNYKLVKQVFWANLSDSQISKVTHTKIYSFGIQEKTNFVTQVTKNKFNCTIILY